jgi:hypothetical protein
MIIVGAVLLCAGSWLAPACAPRAETARNPADRLVPVGLVVRAEEPDEAEACRMVDEVLQFVPILTRVDRLPGFPLNGIAGSSLEDVATRAGVEPPPRVRMKGDTERLDGGSAYSADNATFLEPRTSERMIEVFGKRPRAES